MGMVDELEECKGMREEKADEEDEKEDGHETREVVMGGGERKGDGVLELELELLGIYTEKDEETEKGGEEDGKEERKEDGAEEEKEGEEDVGESVSVVSGLLLILEEY